MQDGERPEVSFRFGQERRELDDHLINLETKNTSWLEPAIAFIRGA